MGITYSKIGNQESVVQQIIETLSKTYPRWHFKKIFSEKKYSEIQKDASILIVWDPPMGALDTPAKDLWKLAIRFPGPCLRLDAAASQEKILVELRAAIQTIG